MDVNRSGLKPGRCRFTEVNAAVERILTDGPRREECRSTQQYETLRRLYAWNQRLLALGPKVAAPAACAP